MPITSMEEIPVLDAEERAKFLTALKDAEAQIEAGEFIEYNAETFKARLLDNFRCAKK
jgi:hypothetical protein